MNDHSHSSSAEAYAASSGSAGDTDPARSATALGAEHPRDAAVQRPPANTAGRDNSAVSLHSINTGENSFVSVSIGGPVEKPSHFEHRPELALVELTSSVELGVFEVGPALVQLRTHRVLVVECSWGDLQWSAVATVTAHLSVTPRAALGRINDTTFSDDPDAPRTSRRGGWSHGWSIEALTRHQASDAARIIVLELDGAAGSAQLDAYFASPGSLRALAATLESSGQYLLLLPRGHTRLHLSSSRAHLGLNVPRLAVPFLSRWLHHRFSELAGDLEILIRQKLKRGDWESEEALYGWLCTLPQELSATEMLQALDDSGEPRPLPAVREAFERCDEKDEVFLTAIFVATHLPSLPQQDFAEAVRALLGDRTRKEDVGTAAPATVPLGTSEVSLASEWHRIARSVLKRADLELRELADGTRVMAFRAAGAAYVLKRELDATPLFVDAQLEALQTSGLLFTLRPALGDAVIDLLVATCVHNPGRLTAEWFIKLFGRRSLRAGATVPAEGPTVSEEWVSLAFLRTAKLLRRLLEVAAESPADRATAVRALTSSVLSTMLHRSPTMGSAALELAYHLRLVPGFEVWRWTSKAFDRPNDRLHRLAKELLITLVDDPASGPEAVEQLVEWLQREDEDALSTAGKAAAAAIGGSLAAALEPLEEGAAPPSLLVALEERSRSAAQDDRLAQLLHVLARFMDLERLTPTALATVLLPELLAQLPEELQALRIDELVIEWRVLRTQHGAAWKPSTHRTALRLALLLTTLRLVRPRRPELLQKLAAAAGEHLRSEARLAREWLGRIEELLCRCEAKVADDLSLSTEARRAWLQQSRERRQLICELRLWMATPSASSLPDSPSRKSAS